MLNRLYGWYGKRVVWAVAGVVVVLAIIGLLLTRGNGTAETTQSVATTMVTLAKVQDLASETSLELVGSVEAVDEVKLQSEASGRITKVGVSLGDTVHVGETIATIENASEYAALLQAQGAYDAAVAAAAGSDVGVAEAANTAVNTYRSAYATVNATFINDIDDLFSDPRAAAPGLKIDGKGYTIFLNNERSAFNQILSDFGSKAAGLRSSDDLVSSLDEAHAVTERALKMINMFLTILPEQPNSGGYYTSSELAGFQDTLSGDRSSLNATLASIESAKDQLERAKISGTGSVISSSDATIKQALGTLKAAQANYDKTIITTPIAGTVNTLSIKTGDYVNVTSPIAVIANNSGLEITTFVSESERSSIAIGDAVVIGNKGTGTIAKIAPAVDPNTGKVEVKVTVVDSKMLNNGDTVSLTLTPPKNENSVPEVLRIPIASVKVTPDGPVVFTLDESNKLISNPVVLGAIQNDSVVIVSGISEEAVIVTDARGLKEGEAVTLSN